MRIFHLSVVCLIAIAFLAINQSAALAPDGCADFLALLRLKPAHVEFVKCELDNDRQGKPLRAIYRVPGAYAAEAEGFFVRAANLSYLKKSCCQWDGPPTQFTGKDGLVHTIYIVSPETSAENRDQWRDITSFEIVVETVTEDI